MQPSSTTTTLIGGQSSRARLMMASMMPLACFSVMPIDPSVRCDLSKAVVSRHTDSHDDSNRTLILASAALTAFAAPARRPAALQPHELRGRDCDRHRGDGRRGDPRLVPHRSRPVPRGDAGRGAGREPLRDARALAVSGASPLRGGHANLCVANENFILAARAPADVPAKLVRFTAVKPSETEKGLTAYLAEEAEYTDDQARDAAIQRLLNITGCDVSPIDGIRGAKTDAATAVHRRQQAHAPPPAARTSSTR